MSKFVYIYYREPGKEDKTPMEEIMKAVTAWFEELGDKLIDGGNPFNSGGKWVDSTGKSGELKPEDWPAIGYSIVNAADMDEAVKLLENCPMRKADGSTVRVYEALPM